MSVYEPRSINPQRPLQRQRRTQAELEDLDRALVEIVAEIEPAIVHGHNRYGGPDDYAQVATEFYRRDGRDALTLGEALVGRRTE